MGFKQHKDTLPAYTKAEIEFPEVHVTGVEIEGDLETHFDDFEFDLKMAVDTSESVDMMDVKAIAPRLNHKNFGYNFHVKNDGAEKHAIVRVYLCPRKTNQGVVMSFDEGRWHCIEMADAAVENGEELDTSEFDKQCGIPNRMLLPKGNKQGMEFLLAVAVSDASADDFATMEASHESHSHCGVRGGEYPDHKPMGFPLDRKIPDDRLFKNSDNIHMQVVKVYHK